MAGGIKVVITLSAICLLAACSTRSTEAGNTRCSYPDSPNNPAPEFICTPEIPGFPLTALRSSPKSDAPVSERIEHVFSDQIQHWSAQWAMEWYADAERQQQAQQFLEQYLADQARVVRSRVSPNEHLWLLIGLPMPLVEVMAASYAAVPNESP